MLMRILMVHPGPDFSVHDLDVFTGWQEAFQELGVEVAAYNLNDRLTTRLLFSLSDAGV